MPVSATYHDLAPTTLYHRVRDSIVDGDIALFRNGGAIERTGYGYWTHAGLIHWNRDRLGRRTSVYIVQFREWRGCIQVALSEEVRRQPGSIDIFRPTCDPDIAWYAQELLSRQLGKHYSLRAILQALAMRLSLVRLVTGWKPDAGNPMLSAWDDPKDCSQGAVFALRLATPKAVDWDIIPNKPDKSAVPSDLAFTGSTKAIARGLVLEQSQVAA